MRFFVFFDMVRQVIGDGQRRHLLRASVSDGLHVYDTPLSDTPVAPNGEQKAPGVTNPATWPAPAAVVAGDATGDETGDATGVSGVTGRAGATAAV